MGLLAVVRSAKEHKVKIIENIVNAISSIINAFPLRIPDDSVGLESRVQEIISLLDVGSNEEVKMVGICGTCGIGKSAIASAVCNFIAHHFEDLWYFSGSSSRLFEIVRGNDSVLDSFNDLIIPPWFPQKKILVILDGIEKLNLVLAVNGGCERFGQGRRIIITTRDRQLLVSHGVEKIYDVKKLSDDEALQMFNGIVFNKNNVKSGHMDVLKRAILCSRGIPLILEAMGRYLIGKTLDEWNFAIDEMEKDPMQMILRFSEIPWKQKLQLKEFVAFMKEKEPQSIHSSTEKAVLRKRKRKREDTEREETQVEGKKRHA
ncbi:disease resistance protein ADR2-like [Prosopis cineraria]|uniref:disease resistance protein ADR2-like n=1 Tax=Prosopis cineraria TaxID=364024 RepID=UPI0024107014|nr:disease resistance protein ADR2-like [Prosopis cineraria]